MFLIASAIAPTSFIGTRYPVTSFSTISGTPPPSVAITGFPAAMASMITCPNGSPTVDA